jgi:long-chain fatty acid transport protein
MKSRLFILTIALLAAVPALATNGYFLHGIGTGSKAMAGATTAFPLEALDADTNPAAGVFVNRGYSFSLAFFSPDRQYTVTGNPSGMPQTFGLTPGTVASKSKVFPMPAFGYNFRPNDASALTFNFTAHGGMNTDYRTSTFYGSDHTGVDLAQMFLTATYARKLTPNQSLGISAVFAEQRFKASGLEAFTLFSSDPDCLTNNGYKWSHGVGLKVGYLAKPLPKLSIGAAYSPAIKMSKFGQYSNSISYSCIFSSICCPPGTSSGFAPRTLFAGAYITARLKRPGLCSMALLKPRVMCCCTTPGARMLNSTSLDGIGCSTFE